VTPPASDHGEPVSVERVLRNAVDALTAAGVDTPRLDAEVLLAHVLGGNRAYLYARLRDPLSPAQLERFRPLLARRAAREPLPHLLGEWEFLGERFSVSPEVLIPRPETELLVEYAAERLPKHARVLDVGAGSGCVAAGLALRLPGARVEALEPSPAARKLAAENFARLGLAARVRLLPGAFPDAVPPGAWYDGIVSNPPYIPTADIDRLQPEVRDHEPRLALDGGPDGLAVLRLLAAEAPRFLRPGGWLALEIGAGQAEAVKELLAAHAWEQVTVCPDFAAIPRVVLARRPVLESAAAPGGPA
jgi:release factor glutamine methyltransferase